MENNHRLEQKVDKVANDVDTLKNDFVEFKSDIKGEIVEIKADHKFTNEKIDNLKDYAVKRDMKLDHILEAQNKVIKTLDVHTTAENLKFELQDEKNKRYDNHCNTSEPILRTTTARLEDSRKQIVGIWSFLTVSILAGTFLKIMVFK